MFFTVHYQPYPSTAMGWIYVCLGRRTNNRSPGCFWVPLDCFHRGSIVEGRRWDCSSSNHPPTEHSFCGILFHMRCRFDVYNHILSTDLVPGHKERGRRRVWNYDITHSHFTSSCIHIIWGYHCT